MTINGSQVRRPEEGWLTLALVAAMAVTLAWAVDDPAWVNGKGELTDVLQVCALLGVVFGFAGPKLGWGRWTTHLVGALFAGLLIPILAGFAALSNASPASAFQHTADGTIAAYLDIAWRGLQYTNEEIHYVLFLGIVLWATTQFGAYAVFGHRRPLNAVVVMGLLLVLNSGLTLNGAAPVHDRVHRRRAVPADRDARVRRAGDVDQAPDRRSHDDLRDVSPGRDGVHRARDGRAPGCSPRARRRTRSPTPGTASTTS